MTIFFLGSNQQTNSKDLSPSDVDSLLKENASLKQENLCLKEENKSIREKILTLEDQLVYQRETSVRKHRWLMALFRFLFTCFSNRLMLLKMNFAFIVIFI